MNAGGKLLAEASARRRELVEAALSYARRGWPVLPIHTVTNGRCSCSKGASCASPGKHPRAARGLSEASTDTATISSWWGRWPDANVAVRAGADAGFIALDVDPRHGGGVSLEALEQEHGPLPETVEALTGGGGRHLLFKHPGRKVSPKVNIRPGLDVRGDGSYIVVAPSVHASCKAYSWELSHHPDDTEMAVAPSWFLELVADKPEAPRKLTALPGGAGATIPDGQRNAALTRLAGAMRRQGASEAEILAALSEANGTRCKPPLDMVELERIAASVARYEPARPGTTFNASDLGNAERFVHQHGHRVRYVHDFARWYIWSGTHWAEDKHEEVVLLARETARSIYAEASACEDDTERRRLGKHALASENAKRIRATLELARSDAEVGIDSSWLDVSPWLLSVRNGTLDLRSGELQAHAPTDYITHHVPVNYDAEATAPRWAAFLKRVLVAEANGHEDVFASAELLQYVQRAVGYSLTGSTREQCFFLLHGLGANGKSTFIETLLALVGEEPLGLMASMETLLHRSNGDGVPTDIARMRAARVVAAVEADAGRRISEGKIKSLTGGDTVTARFLYGREFSFKPTFKIWLAANHRPEVRGTDHAMWRRVRLVPYGVTIPEEEQDKELPSKLKDELPGILAWAVEGARLWNKQGLGDCLAVALATHEYREEEDELGPFISEACILGREYKAHTGELYKAYLAWCVANGTEALSQKGLASRLKDRAENLRSVKVSGRLRQWLGIGLRCEGE